jgi:hemerythrin-like domain-containing protein
MADRPIKRIESLKPLSREHHHCLLFCWKIEQGFKLNIAIDRIQRYADWFWTACLQAHIGTEEKYVFPILGKEHKLIRQALDDHTRLKKLFTHGTNVKDSLLGISELLKAHIRFEERILFAEIQKVATPAQISLLEKHSRPAYEDNVGDEFWIKE